MENNEERYSIEKIEELNDLIDEYDELISKTRLNTISIALSTATMAISSANFIINHGYYKSGLIFGGIVGAIALACGGYDIGVLKYLRDIKAERQDVADQLIKEEAVNETINRIRGGK